MEKYLIFKAAEEYYGIDLSAVEEIIDMRKLMPVSKQPYYVIGSINLKGNLIPIIDVRLRFEKLKPMKDKNCILIVNVQESSVGLIIDEVDGAAAIPEEKIGYMTEVFKDPKRKYIKGIAGFRESIVTLLNSDDLLDAADLAKTRNSEAS